MHMVSCKWSRRRPFAWKVKSYFLGKMRQISWISVEFGQVFLNINLTSLGDNLSEISNPIFWEKWEKYHEFIVCHICLESSKLRPQSPVDTEAYQSLYRLQIPEDLVIISDNFLHKTINCRYLLECLTDICFYGRIRKNIPKLSPKTLH